jgi:DNA-binding CsgD family transcriptional regulator
MTYKEISVHLGIGLGTVKKHIGSVIHKLGARNSAHIVKILYEKGYMPIEVDRE